ncbi:TetR family transcriptional regulator [Propionicicella superfundia]|uniref:TetR/AcrR family transcriptional regulator n=1 Tax=Propionicicella superfundia TaxID=348582 RepID=UPI0004205362|nr:TetR family transcriptional regulator [Propionicicella superfundia]
MTGRQRGDGTDGGPAPAAPSRRGRRTGNPDTRAEILEAARARFFETGYARTSVRSIARTAGVDPALVYHYFQSKRGLFVALLDVAYDPVIVVKRIIEGDRATLGPRVVATALDLWESPSWMVLREGVIQEPDLWPVLGGFLADEVLRRVVSGAQPGDQAWRAAGVETQMVGLFAGRYLMRLQPLASLSHDEIVRLVGPAVQHFLTGDLHGERGR